MASGTGGDDKEYDRSGGLRYITEFFAGGISPHVKNQLAVHEFTAGSVPWMYDSPFAADGDSKVEILEGDKRQLCFLARSNFYGLVAVYETNTGKKTISQVTFTKPPSE